MNKERTNWRDENISKYHRTLGPNCPATDLDTLIYNGGVVDQSEGWIVAEFDQFKTVAIIDYKVANTKWSLADASIKVQADLASDRSIPIPSFVVEYSPDMTSFEVYGTNEVGQRMLGHESVKLTEELFRKFQAYLRNRKPKN